VCQRQGMLTIRGVLATDDHVTSAASLTDADVIPGTLRYERYSQSCPVEYAKISVAGGSSITIDDVQKRVHDTVFRPLGMPGPSLVWTASSGSVAADRGMTLPAESEARIVTSGPAIGTVASDWADEVCARLAEYYLRIPETVTVANSRWRVSLTG